VARDLSAIGGLTLPLRRALQDLSRRIGEVKEAFDAWVTEHTAGPWTDVTFQNSWVNYDSPGAGARNVQYREVGDVYELRGVMKNGTMTATAFTLPEGPPIANQSFVVDSNGAFGNVQVFANGEVRPQVGNNVYVYVDGIRFSVTA
jgi:hypothetical protein